MSNKVLVEICCGSAEDAIEAWHGGADRVELCSALFLGGLTPSLGSLLELKAQAEIKVAAIIRPRQGGFCYSESDFRAAMHDAEQMLKHGADALVFGFLHADGRVDLARTRAMVELAGGRAQRHLEGGAEAELLGLGPQRVGADVHADRGEGQAHGQQGGGVELPVGHHDADGGDHRSLEDHGAGDIADSQGILALVYPDHTVEFLRQFGCDRRDDQGRGQHGRSSREGDRG